VGDLELNKMPTGRGVESGHRKLNYTERACRWFHKKFCYKCRPHSVRHDTKKRRSLPRVHRVDQHTEPQGQRFVLARR